VFGSIDVNEVTGVSGARSNWIRRDVVLTWARTADSFCFGRFGASGHIRHRRVDECP
jgi:hypothetical protein